MARVTKTELKAKAENLLDLVASVERYEALKKEISAGMKQMELVGKENAIAVDGKGSIFIFESDRVTISPESVRALLPELAEQIIQIKESVPNKIVEAFLKGRLITREQYDALDEQAQRTPVTSFYVRPLN